MRCKRFLSWSKLRRDVLKVLRLAAKRLRQCRDSILITIRADNEGRILARKLRLVLK